MGPAALFGKEKGPGTVRLDLFFVKTSVPDGTVFPNRRPSPPLFTWAGRLCVRNPVHTP